MNPDSCQIEYITKEDIIKGPYELVCGAQYPYGISKKDFCGNFQGR